MIHFLYLIAFGLFIAMLFAIVSKGDQKAKAIYGLKIFGQFVGISLVMAWVFYFLPW